MLFEISGDEIFTNDLDSIVAEIGCAAEVKFGQVEYVHLFAVLCVLRIATVEKKSHILSEIEFRMADHERFWKLVLKPKQNIPNQTFALLLCISCCLSWVVVTIV